MTDQSPSNGNNGTQRLDSLTNLVTGMGGSRDVMTSFNAGWGFRTDWMMQSRLYETQSDIQKICNIMPAYMVDQGGKIVMGGDDADNELVQKVHDRLEELPCQQKVLVTEGYQNALCEAQSVANKTGNAALILQTQERGSRLEDPLDYKKLIDVTGLYLLDRWEIRPEIYGGGFMNANEYFVVYSTNILGPDNKPLQSQRIHRSRVMWFRGTELSGRSLIENQGCDLSVIDAFLGAMFAHGSAYENLGRMLQDAGVVKHAIDGLLDGLLTGGQNAENAYRRRMQNLYDTRSNYKVMLVDKNLEESGFIERGNLSGVADVANALLDRKIADSGLTRPLMTGDSLGGFLTANNPSEQQALNKSVAAYQRRKCTSQQRQLVKALLNCEEVRGKAKVPPSWKWEWNPVYPQTQSEKVDLMGSFVQMLSTVNQIDPDYAKAGLLSAFSSAEFNPTIVLLPEVLKRKQDEAKAEPQTEEQGFATDEFQSEVAPEEEAPTEERTESMDSDRLDDSTSIKKVLPFHGFEIGLQYQPFDKRHGKTLPIGYGHLRKTKGDDGMAVDCYVGSDLASTKIFAVRQLDGNGDYDETKLFVGFDNIDKCAKLYQQIMSPEQFGGIREMSLSDLDAYRTEQNTKADSYSVHFDGIEYRIDAPATVAPKKKNCTEKSVYCVGKTGKGACVSKTRAKNGCKAKVPDEAKATLAAVKEKVKADRGGLSTQKDFESEVLKVYDRINRKEDLSDLVPVYRLRREIGDRVSRQQFDDWMLNMQANDIFQLQKGEVKDLTPDKLKDAIHTQLGGVRYYAKRLKPALPTTVENKAKPVEVKSKTKPAPIEDEPKIPIKSSDSIKITKELGAGGFGTIGLTERGTAL
jgi:hypothetical protein